MTTRYVAIDHNSGLVWGEAVAETPEAACTMIHKESGGPFADVAFSRVDPIRDDAGGYHLYELEDCFFEAEMSEEVQDFGKYVGDFRPEKKIF
jgi:hypothetical protein